MIKTEKSKIAELANLIKENKTKLISASLFALVIILFIVFVYVRIQVINNSASDKLNTATQIIASGNLEQGMIIVDDLMKNYKNTPAAYRAQIMKASNLIYEKKYEQAEQLLKNYMETAKPEIVRPIAYPLLIAIYDDNNNTEQAIATSKEFLSKYENNYLAPSITENLAFLYEKSGKKEEAEKTYKAIIDKYPDTIYAKRASAKSEKN